MRELLRRQTAARGSDAPARMPPVQKFAPAQAASAPAQGHDFGNLAIHDPGAPLPFLDRIQRSFGAHDVTSARAHFGGDAARASHDLGANAFTSGNDVVFGRTPDLRVAAHEAAHVVQQRAGVSLDNGVGKRGDRYERQADEAAERVMQGKSSENLFSFGTADMRGRALQRDDPPPGTTPPAGPASAPASAPATVPAPPPPLRYDRRRWTINSPDPALTEAEAEKRVKALVTTVKVLGITAAAPAETRLYLLNALRQVAFDHANWGQELDVVAPVARAAKAGTPDPVGRITIRIDDSGNAEVEMVAAGPTPASPATTVAAATTKLKAAPYSVKAVRDDGTATWSDAELSDVAAAFDLIPAADRAAVNGIELIRVKSIKGGFAGEYSTGGGVAKGAVTVTALPYLQLADGAFADLAGQKFYGGATRTVPASYDVILHEVGHAVEKEVYRTAHEAEDKAVIDVNKKVIPLNASVAKYKTMSDEYARLYELYKKEGDATKKAELASKLTALNTKMTAEGAKATAARAKYDAAVTVREAKARAVKATSVAGAVVTPLETDATTKKANTATAISGAKAILTVIKPELVTSSKAYVDAIDATSAAIDTFATSANAAGAVISDLEDVVKAQIQKRDTERENLSKAEPTNPVLARFKAASDAQDEWFSAVRTAVRAPNRTLRVQKFIDLVNARGIVPFTSYARENWPFKPEEFYAEAYALWVTDPDYLSKYQNDVFKFFDSGDYRK